jgi:hypothetical protein
MHHGGFQPVAAREQLVMGALTSWAAQHGDAALAVQECRQPVEIRPRRRHHRARRQQAR